MLGSGACAQRDRVEPARADFGERTLRRDAPATATASRGPTLSRGCGVSGKPTGDLHLTARDGNGALREYEALVPDSYSPSTPLALYFAYHGANGKSSDAKAFGLQDAPGAATSAIFVFPQGIQFQSAGVGWDDRCQGYDMPFFDNMLAALGANYCIDTSRVYAAGFSWGCDQVTALACCRGNQVRGIAAASCSDEFATAANYQSYANLPCPVSPSTAIRFTHALDGDGGYPSPLFATTSSLYRSFADCASTSKATSPAPCRSYDGCREPFVECAYPNFGHSIPADWGNESWAFFRSLPATSPTPVPAPALPRPSFGLLVFALLIAALWSLWTYRVAL